MTSEMTIDEVYGVWDGLDWSDWERDLIEEVREKWLAWLCRRRQVVTHDDDPPWDCSGRLKDDHWTTQLDRLLMYETLGEWAENERAGSSEATYESGMGLYYPTYASELSGESENQIRETLLSAIRDGDANEDDDFDDAVYWRRHEMATEWAMQHLENPTYEFESCCDSREVWIEALADHIRHRQQPDTEFVDALTQMYPDIAAFGLPVANAGDAWGGDATRWLIACDWLADRDGGPVADAIRAVMG